MSRPVARIGDPFTTPLGGKNPHVGGVISGPGAPRVLIEGRPAATVGDVAPSAGPPYTVAEGSPRVLVGGRPAVRAGDALAPGGRVVAGAGRVVAG